MQYKIDMNFNYQIPYTFILKALYPKKLKVARKFGGYVLYEKDTVYFFLRNIEFNPEYNGVYVATTVEHFNYLQEHLHKSFMEVDLDGEDNTWIFLSEDLEDFETKVEQACNLLKNNSGLIGKVII